METNLRNRTEVSENQRIGTELKGTSKEECTQETELMSRDQLYGTGVVLENIISM